jgi:hypothetical protein
VASKPLVGIVLFTQAKDYALPKFYEMMDACVNVHDVDVLFVTDQPVPDKYEAITVPNPGAYAEDMLTFGRDLLREEAIKRGSSCMVWQGVDCFYQRASDFKQLVAHVLNDGDDIKCVGALTTSRADSHHAILRRFYMSPEVLRSDRKSWEFTDIQADYPPEVIDAWVAQGSLSPVGGFPGADALVIHPDLFEIDFSGHDPWYVRVSQGRENLCVEEYWCQKVLNAGYDIYLDPSIQVWHCHDVDLVARMWRGIEKPMSEVSW